MALFKLNLFEVDFAPVGKALAKASIWMVATALFGSVALILVGILSKLNIIGADTKLKEHIDDLFIVFLCCAIISQLSFEAFLCKIKFGKYSYLFFFGSAALAMFCACIYYTIIFMQKGAEAHPDETKPTVNFAAVGIFQIIFIIYTVLYTLFLKVFLFMEEDKIYKVC